MPQKGYKQTAEHRAKIAAALQGNSNWRESSRVAGAQHGRWRGDDAGRNAVHMWLNKHYAKTACEECGSGGRLDWAYRHANGEWSRDRADYRVLCPSCHQRFDRDKDLDGVARAELIRTSDESGRELARRFGISPQLVCDIRKGRKWAPIGQ
jgi:hypothetical protein